MVRRIFNKILMVFTKRKSFLNCANCKNEFKSNSWKSFLPVLGFIGVIESFCSIKCENEFSKKVRGYF